MKTPFPATWMIGFVAAGLLLGGCEDGGDDNSPDTAGSDGAGVVVCLGDSITQGVPGSGTPFPARLAALTGRTVINAGVGGQQSSAGASRAQSVITANKPTTMTILYGANDITQGHTHDEVIVNLLHIVGVCRANQVTPILATTPPMIGSHAPWAESIVMLNEQIRSLAAAEKVRLVDLEGKFGSKASSLLLPDGLHPNDAGNDVIAKAFAGAL